METNKKPKILLFDIETAPNLGYTWGKWKQNVINFKNNWYILSFAAKWLGSKKIIKYKLNDFKLFKKDKTNDYEVVKRLWELFDEADVIIGHNEDKFDIKKANTRFIYHNMLSPSYYKTIDTLKIARKYFSFTSNKLDDLGKLFKIGKKEEHNGFKTWLGCMNGDKKSWKIMIKYNVQDVLLLEKLYKKFLGWITNHPNIGLLEGKSMACPNCGSTFLQKNGIRITKTNKYQRYRCINCGANSQSVYAEKNIIKNQVKN